MKNWNFFGSWAKLELHIVVRSWVSLGNTTFMGGLWSNGINFDDVHCYEILTRALVAMDPKKSPREPHFWWIFLDFILWNFLWGTIPFLWYLLCKSTKSAFFLRFLKKKSKNLTFWMISPNNHVQTGHFIITKFCQDAKKTILVKVWPLIKSLLAVCHSTADPKSLNFISKCIFMDSDRSVSAQMGFSKQIMALANKSFIFGWYQPTMAAIGRSAANFCSSRLFLIFFKYFKVR